MLLNNSEINFLIKKIPSIEKIFKKKLTFKQIVCLKKIYNHYKNNQKNSKSKLRKELRNKRDKLNILKIKKKSYKLNKKLLKTKEYLTAKTVFCYISFDSEIDTFLIIDHAYKNKKLAVPVIKGDKIIPALFTDFENLKKNKYGIYEPKNIIEIPIDQIDLAIVPAIAYNPLGYRIGYGKGLYDKFLKNYKGISIGLILKQFYITNLIPEEHDYPVDIVLTL